MRNKQKAETWDNGVTLYRMKEKAEDHAGMEAVVNRIRTECA